MAKRTAFAEDLPSGLIVIARIKCISDRAIQAETKHEKAFQAEATANVQHEPELPP
jgi:hypothetical protein